MFYGVYPALASSVVLFGLCQGIALAHANAGIDAIDAIGDREGGLAGVETTIGYIRPADDGRFSWICHESVTQPDALITPQYTENRDGTMLVTIADLAQARDEAEGIYRSTDGCEWSTTSGLSNHKVASVHFDPLDPDRVAAVTNTAESGNGVFLSSDGGSTWIPIFEVGRGWIFTSVRFSETPEQFLWATSRTEDGRQHTVHRTNDDGRTWTHQPFEIDAPDDAEIQLSLLVADLEDSRTAWLAAGPFLDDTLYRTNDGGLSFEPVYRPQAAIIDAAQANDGSLWLTVSGNKVLHSTDGETFKRIESAPLSIGVGAIDGRVMLATRIPSAGSALSECTAPDQCEPTPTFELLEGPPVCPPDSQSSMACDPLWPSLERAIFGSTDTGDPGRVSAAPTETNATKSKSATGCASAHFTGRKRTTVLLVLFASVGILRRPTVKKKRPDEHRGASKDGCGGRI